MKRNSVLEVIVFLFLISIPFKTLALTVKEKIEIEANYILSCQYIIDPNNSAYGAINNVYGEPTWIVPRENGMAILGLIDASKALEEGLYIERAQLDADYLVRIQNEDGSWSDQYSYSDAVRNSKSPTQTAEVMIAFYKLGYSPIRYEAMKKGAQYLIECKKVENKKGIDDGLVCGGKDENGSYYSDRWTHDNGYSYWALTAASIWADFESDSEFSLECKAHAQDIINGIDDYLYDSDTGVWYIAINENAEPLKNPHLSCLDSNSPSYPSWIQYSPQMLDLPVERVNSFRVGEWIHCNLQEDDGGCIDFYCEGDLKKRKYPGLSFQAALVWLDMDIFSFYSELAIEWAENSGLWIFPEIRREKWVDWNEIEPDPNSVAAEWLAFIDTSFYSIACWNGGYDFTIKPPEKPEDRKGCFISCFLRK